MDISQLAHKFTERKKKEKKKSRSEDCRDLCIGENFGGIVR